MEPNPSLGADGGKRLTNEDQRERLQHFQRQIQDGQNGSRDDNLSERQDRSGDQEGQTPVNFTDLSISSKDTIRCNSDGDQPRNFTRKMAENDNIGYFDLTGNDSSFAVCATTSVSEVKESQTRDCGSCFAKPLSSTVSEPKSQDTASSTKVPDREVTTRCFREEGISPVETKVEQGNVQYQIPSEQNAGKQSQGFEENQRRSGEKAYSPLVSKEASVSRCDSEGDSDEESYDVLVLYDPEDKEHLGNFVRLCEKNKWTTLSRDEFTMGEPHFEHLDEVIDNCTLVVALVTLNSLNQSHSKLEHHTGLLRTRTNKFNNFIPVVCEESLKLPSYILAISHGHFYNESFEKQLRKTMKIQRKKQEKLRNPPMNQLNSFDREKQQNKQQGPVTSVPSASEKSAPEVFRGLQGNLSPGPNAQRFFSDDRFRELCLVLDLRDPLGSPYWHLLADAMGLTSQEIHWQDDQERCAANVLEFYFYRHSSEPVEDVLRDLVKIMETKLDYLQAISIIVGELEEQSVSCNGGNTRADPSGMKEENT